MSLPQVMCELGIDPDAEDGGSQQEIEDRQYAYRREVFSRNCAMQKWTPADLGEQPIERVRELLRAEGVDVQPEMIIVYVNEFVQGSAA